MKLQSEVVDLLAADRVTVERTLGIKIRNGQAFEAYKKTLAWVLKDEVSR